MVSLKLEVKKKDLTWLIPLFVVLIVGVVYAYNSGASPSVMGHSAGEVEGTVSSGFCVFSRTQTGCPTGWTRDSGFDSRTIRGAATPGGTGGSDTHTHTGPSHTHTGGSYALTTANLAAHTHSYAGLTGSGSPGYAYWIIPDGGSGARLLSIATSSAGSGTAHSHGATSVGGTGATSSVSSWSPYIDVIICCKN